MKGSLHVNIRFLLQIHPSVPFVCFALQRISEYVLSREQSNGFTRSEFSYTKGILT